MSVDENEPEARARADTVFWGASRWFFAIAAVTLVNTVIAMYGGSVRFTLGAGFAQLMCSYGTSLAAELHTSRPRFLGASLAVVSAGLFALAGVLSRQWYGARRALWVFAAGLGLWALDSVLMAMLEQRGSVLMHALVAVALVRGLARLFKNDTPQVLQQVRPDSQTAESRAIDALIAQGQHEAALTAASELFEKGILTADRLLFIVRREALESTRRDQVRALLARHALVEKPWALLRVAVGLGTGSTYLMPAADALVKGDDQAIIAQVRLLAASRPTAALALNEALSEHPSLASLAATIDNEVLRSRKPDSITFALVIGVIIATGYTFLLSTATSPFPYEQSAPTPTGYRPRFADARPPVVELCARDGGASRTCQAARAVQLALDVGDCAEAHRQLVEAIGWLDAATPRETDATEHLGAQVDTCKRRDAGE